MPSAQILPEPTSIVVNGDQKPDLVVAHSDVHVVVLENRGSAKQPMFADPKPLEGPDGKPLTLPKGCCVRNPHLRHAYELELPNIVVRWRNSLLENVTRSVSPRV